MAKVSIIIPVFNKEKFISETLLSVKEQKFSDWECFLVDDGSNDTCLEIIENFIRDEPKFNLIKRPAKRKKGASTCRNIGIEKSTSEYVQFLDADDLLSENKLEEQVALMESGSYSDLVTCRWGRVNNNKRDLYKNFPSYKDFSDIPEFLDSLVSGSRGYFPIHAYLIRREIIERAGPWNESLPIKNDGEFMMRVIANSKKIRFSSSAAVWYRVADQNNLSRSTNFEAIDRAIYGLKMTDGYLGAHFGNAHENYMEWHKNQFFVLLKKTAPQLISEHKDFFRHQINNRVFIHRCRKKLSSLLKTRFRG